MDPPPVQVQDATGAWFDAVQEPLSLPLNPQTISSWDCSFKGGIKADYVVGQTWFRNGAKFYLLDQSRDQMDFPDTVAAVRAVYDKWRPLPTLIEGKANGPAVIASLRGEIPGLLEVNPEGGKESRLAAVSPLFEAGNVYLPHPCMFPWVEESITEVVTFPKAPHDDVADALSQALVHMQDRRAEVVDMGSTYGDSRDSTGEDLISESYWAN